MSWDTTRRPRVLLAALALIAALGIAALRVTTLSNIGGVYTRRKDFVRAEKLFREALQAYAGTLPPTHQNVGITRIRLGDAILKQGRFAESEKETLAGYTIVSKQAATSTRWLQPARQNLAVIYDSLRQPQMAEKFRAEFAAAEKKSTSAAAAK